MQIIAHTMEYDGEKIESNLQLRTYHAEDFNEYRRVYDECFHEMRTALALTPVNCCDDDEKLLLKASQIFILEEKGSLIGSVAVYGNEIDDLIVAKEFQGKGYGRALLEFAVHNMQNRGIAPIILHVADWNRNAVRLYLKRGFKIVKTETIG